MIKHLLPSFLLFGLTLGTIIPLGGCTQSPEKKPQKSSDVFLKPPVAPLKQANLLGKSVFTLNDQDVVLPTFSADEKWLAYSQVVVKNKTELTEIWAHNLKTGKKLQLLKQDDSKKYAVYSAFVHALKWQGKNHLTAYVSDGDVDGTEVTWEIPSGKKIRETQVGGDEGERDYLKKLKAMKKELLKKPALPQAVLETALMNGFRIKRGLYVVQKKYAGHDDHIWRLNHKGQMTILMKLPDRPGYYLRQGFQLGQDIVFFLSAASHNRAYLFVHRNGKAEKLKGFDAPLQNANLKVLRIGKKGVWFLAKLARSYETPKESGLFFYGAHPRQKSRARKENNLLKPKGFQGLLHSAEISPSGKLIAMSLWDGKKRKLVVRELKVTGN